MGLRLSFFLSGLICAAAQSCYYPNGDLSTSDAPCTDTDGDSFCCSSSYYCLSNRLCQWQDGRLYRGSCTDEDWTSGNCPQFCQNNNPGNGIQLWLCNIDLNTYCCSTNNSDTNTCCGQEGVELITLAAPTTIGQIVSTTFDNFQTSSTTSATTTRSSSSFTSISSSSSSTSTSSETRSTSSTSSYGTTSGTVSGTGSAIPAETDGGDGGTAGGGGSNTGAIAGGAVGGVAVLGAIALGAWWIWLRKRKGTAAGDAPSSPNDTKETYQYYGGPQGGYYQSAPQHEPREMDGGQQMIPQEMDTEPQRQQVNAWHELPAESMPHR